MHKYLLLLIFTAISFSGYSQVFGTSPLQYTGEAVLQGNYATGERLPFWMYQNTRGRISPETNFAGWVTGRMNYEIDFETTLEVGAGVLFRDGIDKPFFVDEVYLHFVTRNFYITAGRKQREELYNGISASNRSLLWSLNARPLPGIQFGTNGPIFPFGNEESGFGIEGSWNEYYMDDDRYVDYAKLHHKNLLFVFRSANREPFEVKAGLQHFVQWGGNSPRLGPQPESFVDYLRIVTGVAGGPDASEGDRLNALGNHVGGYELYVSKEFYDFRIEAFYNHIFEDGSGRRLGNTPDGRYGIFYEMNDRKKLLHSVIYEFFTTHHQSHTTTGVHKTDNYLNSGVYQSGWTYHNRVMGAPFFTVNPNDNGIINNKFTAHHLGISGDLGDLIVTYPYKIMLSYAQNDGLRHRRYNPKQEVAYIYSELGLFRKAVDLDVQFGAEFNSYTAPTFGVGVQLRKSF